MSEKKDHKLYLCSKCCRRFYWGELSRDEHRCRSCILPQRSCLLCSRKFEPRSTIEMYCKRCEFHFVKEVSNTPPPVLDMELDSDTDTDTEPEPKSKPKPNPKPLPVPLPVPAPEQYEQYEQPRQHSMTKRWDQIRKAAGL